MNSINNYYEATSGAKKETTRVERLLLLGALAIGLAFDRLVVGGSFNSLTAGNSVFWLVYLAAYYALNWEKAKRRREAWFTGAFAAVVCVWNLLFDQAALSVLSLLLLPATLMLHAQLGVLEVTSEGNLLVNWVFGFFAEPFLAVGRFFSSIASLFSNKNKRLSYVLIGLLVALPIAAIALALLLSADSVFGYFGQKFFENISIGSIIVHAIIVLILAMLFYSFLWHTRHKPDWWTSAKRAGSNWEPLAIGVLLGVLLGIYALFALVQFAYLFAGAALPSALTYSEYARSGFFELLAVAALNFAVFAISLRFTRPSKVIRGMLGALLLATALLLVSGVMRLVLYINAYGLTLLRILPMWFMVFLAIALVLAAVRLAKPKLPLMRLTAAAFMVMYLALSFVNVDALIVSYNTTQMGELSREEIDYIYSLSDDCVPGLINYAKASGNDMARLKLELRLAQLHESGAYSISAIRARSLLEEFVPNPRSVGEVIGEIYRDDESSFPDNIGNSSR